MNRLTCQEFEDRLNDVLDLRQSPQQDHRLTRHARVCSGCKRRLATQQSIISAVEPRAAAQNTYTNAKHAAGHWFLVSAAIAAAITITITLFAPTRNDADQQIASASVSGNNDSGADVTENVMENEGTSRTLDGDTVSSPVDAAIETWSEFIVSSTSNTEWLEPVASPIRPLANSVSSTFNVLRQTLPQSRRDTKSRSEPLESAQIASPTARFA